MDDSFIDVSRIPTGIPVLDVITQGGYTPGTLTGVRGASHSGKRTLAYHAIAEQQRLGKRCALIQFGHKLDACYAAAIGVKLADLEVTGMGPFKPSRLFTDNDATSILEEVVGLLQTLQARDGRTPDLLVIDGVPSPKLGRPPVLADVVASAMKALEWSGAACLYTVPVPRTASWVRLPALYARGLRPLEWRTPVRIQLTRCAHSHLGCGDTASHVHVNVIENEFAEPCMMAVLDVDTAGGVIGGRLSPETLVRIGSNWGLLRHQATRALWFRGENLGCLADAITRVSRDADLAKTLQAALTARLEDARGDRR